MLRLMALVVVLMPLSVFAEIYSWTDAAGTIHFSEDLSSVPKKYRTAVIRKGDASAGATTVPAIGAGKQSVDPSLPAAASPAVQGTAEKPGNGLYGGKAGPVWQAEFQQRRARVQELDAQIRQLQDQLKNPREIVSPARVDALNARSRELAKQYETAASDLNQLVEQANQVGLPPAFAR